MTLFLTFRVFFIPFVVSPLEPSREKMFCE